MKSVMEIKMMGPLVIMMILILPMSSSALTTFGKTNPQNQNPPPPPTPVGKARECKTEADCAAIQNTTCMAEPRDDKKRCLCGDYSAPVNGFCANKFKAVNAPCSDHAECGDGAQCVQGNNTTNGRTCQCMEGYYVDNMKCNGSLSLLSNPSTLVLLFSLILLRNISYS